LILPMSRFHLPLLRLVPLAILSTIGAAQLASAGGVLDGIAYAVDGAESSHGRDPKMWRAEPDGPQGPMQVSAAAASDAGGGDRFDETQNRALGRAYLAHMYRRYGSWPDAIAAYNWGPGHLDEWISGGRPIDKFPPAVERYRNRVLVTSGLPGAAGGVESLSQWANLRLARLERLRILAKREMAERRRGGRGADMVQLLYRELMRSTAPGTP
jgi:Transglycosylase SLT domain